MCAGVVVYFTCVAAWPAQFDSGEAALVVVFWLCAKSWKNMLLSHHSMVDASRDKCMGHADTRHTTATLLQKKHVVVVVVVM